VLDQTPITPAGPPPEIQLDKPIFNLQSQGRRLAEDHQRQELAGEDHSSTSSTALLSARLPGYTSILIETAGRLQAQTSLAGQLSLAAEWLLDNYHLVTQALREVQLDLPPHYERQLPRLQTGHPRTYELSAQIIQTEHALLDLENVERFVAAYQEVLPLTMGELWALPTMLRLGILESLLAAVARFTELTGVEIKELAPILESPGQLGDQLIVENSIRSLRILAFFDWKRFFETLSLVDFTLRQDPARIYSGMDFESRDRYRKAVEEIASSGRTDELAVARAAVSLARTRAEQPTLQPEQDLHESTDSKSNIGLKDHPEGWDGFRSQPGAHIGYYLLGQGRPDLEQVAGYTPKGQQRFERFIHNHYTLFYLGSIERL